jgi:hypothetical protein
LSNFDIQQVHSQPIKDENVAQDEAVEVSGSAARELFTSSNTQPSAKPWLHVLSLWRHFVQCFQGKSCFEKAGVSIAF